MEKVFSYVKNSQYGKVIGISAIILILGISYYFIEVVINQEEVEIKNGTIQMKTFEKGEDGTVLIDKEKQLENYIAEEKERSEKQDFFIKNAYYINDDDKRDFDGKTLNVKDFDITQEEEVIVEPKIEVPEIKIETPIEVPNQYLVDEILACNDACVKKLYNIEKLKSLSIPELEKLKAECLVKKAECEKVHEEVKVEEEEDEKPKMPEKKEIDMWDVKPPLEQMEPEAVAQYKNARMALLVQLAQKPHLHNSAVSVVRPKPLEEISKDSNIDNTNKDDYYIMPGSSFYGTLLNNLNSSVVNNVAIIEFSSRDLKGFKAIGTTVPNNNGETMSIVVNELIDPKGKRIQVRAFAVDAENMESTFSDHVDSKMLKRIGLTSASIVLNAFGDAKTTSEASGGVTTATQFGTTTTTPVQNFVDLFAGNVAKNTGERLDEYLVEELQKSQNEIKIDAGKKLIVIFH